MENILLAVVFQSHLDCHQLASRFVKRACPRRFVEPGQTSTCGPGMPRPDLFEAFLALSEILCLAVMLSFCFRPAKSWICYMTERRTCLADGAIFLRPKRVWFMTG